MDNDHDHTLDCPICGTHLDSQQELTKHNRECHVAQSASAQSGEENSRSISRSGSKRNDLERNF